MMAKKERTCPFDKLAIHPCQGTLTSSIYFFSGNKMINSTPYMLMSKLSLHEGHLDE
jgi:hypothetical protein